MVFGCSCILVILGAQTNRSLFMIPYLIVQMLVIAMMAIIGIPIAAVLFYLDHPYYGTSISTVVVISAILPVVYWFIVKRAYTLLKEGGTLDGEKNLNREKDLESG